jgi:uncharacterized damage-inducible protein DinB
MLPENDEYPGYYEPFIRLSSPVEVVRVLEETGEEVSAFIRSIPNEFAAHRYAEGEWDLRQILVHIIDTERIYAYRALRVARKDETELPGFDENRYAANCNSDQRSLEEILDEFQLVRKSTIALFRQFDQETLLLKGIANEKKMTVRAIGHIIAGHALHHCNIIRERYLN